jgi:hypothetical protein
VDADRIGAQQECFFRNQGGVCRLRLIFPLNCGSAGLDLRNNLKWLSFGHLNVLPVEVIRLLEEAFKILNSIPEIAAIGMILQVCRSCETDGGGTMVPARENVCMNRQFYCS